MIRKEEREISSIYIAGKAISIVRKGAYLIWEAINSCFGKGLWINDKPWDNKGGWKNT